jgi:signal transduction histidine kinase
MDVMINVPTEAVTAGRPARWRNWRVDLAIALGVCAVQVVFTHFAAQDQPERRSLDVLAYAPLTIGPVALVARRRYPVAVLAIAFCATLAYWVIGYPRGPIFIAQIVALFAVVTAGQRLAALLVLALGYVSFLWLPYLLGREPAPSLAAALGLAAWLLVLLGSAEFVRARRERTREAVRMREEEARRRASEERLRIARDLHDVLAHNISLINVQAGVALHLMDERPEQARTALSAIKQASKDALTELRSVLDILRGGDEHAPRAPAPTLARLDDLVSRAAAAGLAVRTEIEGEARALPSGVDGAAFRVVQEALTNVTRHAGPATATVRLSYGERDLTVQVDDDGLGSVPHGEHSTLGSGKGIVGMRERVTVLGGDLEAGPRPGGGFRVRARLPLDGAP